MPRLFTRPEHVCSCHGCLQGQSMHAHATTVHKARRCMLMPRLFSTRPGDVCSCVHECPTGLHTRRRPLKSVCTEQSVSAPVCAGCHAHAHTSGTRCIAKYMSASAALASATSFGRPLISCRLWTACCTKPNAVGRLGGMLHAWGRKREVGTGQPRTMQTRSPQQHAGQPHPRTRARLHQAHAPGDGPCRPIFINFCTACWLDTPVLLRP